MKTIKNLKSCQFKMKKNRTVTSMMFVSLIKKFKIQFKEKVSLYELAILKIKMITKFNWRAMFLSMFKKLMKLLLIMKVSLMWTNKNYKFWIMIRKIIKKFRITHKNNPMKNIFKTENNFYHLSFFNFKAIKILKIINS